MPVLAAVYALTTAAQMHDALDKLGWRVASLVVVIVCVAWTAYIWAAKRPSHIDPSQLQCKYDWKTRFGALAAAVVSLIPAGYALLPGGPRVPFLLFKVVNTRDAPIEIYPFGDAYFKVPSSPYSERLIESTRIRFYSGNSSNDAVTVPAKSDAFTVGRFLNDRALVPLLDREDVQVDIVVRTYDGRSFKQDGIPFNRKDMVSGYIPLRFE